LRVHFNQFHPIDQFDSTQAGRAMAAAEDISPTVSRLIKKLILLALAAAALFGLLLTLAASPFYLIALVASLSKGSVFGAIVLILAFAFPAILLFLIASALSGLFNYSDTEFRAAGSLSLIAATLSIPAIPFLSFGIQSLHLVPIGYVRENFPLAVRKELQIRLPVSVWGAEWTPDGAEITALGNPDQVEIVLDRSGRILKQIPLAGVRSWQGVAPFVDGSSRLLFEDGRYDPGADTMLSVYNITTGKVERLVDGPERGAGQRNRANMVAVSPDQRLVATNLQEVTPTRPHASLVAVSDTNDWQVIKSFHVVRGPISMGFFGRGTDLVYGCVDGRVGVIDPRSGASPREYWPFRHVHKYLLDAAVQAVAGSPDGQLIFASAGDAPNDTIVIRVSDGVLVARFPNEHAQAGRVTWDPRGRYLAFIDTSGDLVLWRPTAALRSYEKVAVPHQLSTIVSMAVSPDGEHIAIATGDTITLFVVP
jgi:hypothetical protein